jgi:hypothetical protein
VRVLLDECLPFDLVPLLVGHEVTPVARAGWAGVKNGALLALAVEHGFAAFITIDKRLAQDQPIPPRLAVIALRGRSNRVQDLALLVPAILEGLATCLPGSVCRVGA